MKKLKSSEVSTFQKYFSLFLLGLACAVIYKVPYMREYAYTPLVDGLGISNEELGNIYAVVGTVATMGYFFGGVLADKFNTKLLLVVSLAGAGVAILWFATMPSLIEIKIIHGLLALFSLITFWCAYLKGIRMMGTKDEQGRMFGVTEGIRGITGTLVALIAVYLIEQGVTKTGGLSAALVFYGVLHLALAAAIWFFMPAVESDDQGGDGFSLAALKQVLLMPSVWAVLLVIFGLYNVFAMISYTSPYLEQVWGVPTALVGVLGSIRMYLIATLGSPIGGIYGDKIGDTTKALIQGCVLLILTIAVFLFLPTGISYWAAVAMVMLFALVLFMVRGVQFATMTAAQIPVNVTGTALGLICTLAYVPDIYLFKQIGGWLDTYPAAEAYNMIFMYMIAATAVALIGGLWVMKIAKKHKESLEMNAQVDLA